MHKDNLPLRVDPFRFADQSLSLSGVLLIKDMPRLCSSLSSDEGDVKVDLIFGVDEEGLRYLKGHMTTCLILECQRCLESFRYEIINNFMLGIVRTEKEADRLPERYDPLLVSDLSLVLNDMVEEELIVSLPIVAMHEIDQCKAKQSFEILSSDAIVEKENPFKVIESLRSKRSSK